MDRQVTSPTWGPPPPCKQALRAQLSMVNFSCAAWEFDVMLHVN